MHHPACGARCPSSHAISFEGKQSERRNVSKNKTLIRGFAVWLLVTPNTVPAVRKLVRIGAFLTYEKASIRINCHPHSFIFLDLKDA